MLNITWYVNECALDAAYCFLLHSNRKNIPTKCEKLLVNCGGPIYIMLCVYSYIYIYQFVMKFHDFYRIILLEKWFCVSGCVPV